MIIMNSNYHYSTHQFPPFTIDLNQDHQHYLNPHNYFTTTTTTTTTNSSPSSSSSSPLPYHIFISPPPSTHRATEDTDPTTHGHQLVATAQDYSSSWGPPPTSFHQYQPPLHLQTMYDHEMDDHNRWGEGAVPLESNDKMEKETVAPKLRIMKKKKLTIKTNNNINNNNPSNVNDVPSPSTLQPAAAPNNNNNGSNSPTAVRVCSDCNTTKTPLWRSGPQGPKSLCNACGIRQRKARRAMAAAAAAAIAEGGDIATIAPPPTMIKMKTSSSSPCKMIGEWTTSNKEKKKRKRNNNDNLGSSNNSHLPLKKRGKFSVPRKMITSSSNTISDNNNNNSNKLCFEELAAIFNNDYSFQRVFPQDEKEAAILLMALSYGLLHT